MARTDQFFKDILRTFLPDFMRVFFPREVERLDFTPLRFRDKELFTGWPTGRRRVVDLLVEVGTQDGAEELLYLHIEVQARNQAEFARRMWEYYLVLRPRLQRPVLLIALVLARNSGGLTTRSYVDTVLSHEINRFQYLVVGVRDLEEADYRASEIPLAHAFRSLMRTSAPRDELELDCLRHLYTSALDDERKYMLGVTPQQFSPLSKREKARLEERLQREEPQMHQWMTAEAEEKVKSATRKSLRIVLEAKFGELPPWLDAAIERLTTRQVEGLLRKSQGVNSLEELGLSDA